MKIKFWGVRGSIPTPGKSTVRYGGNTPSIELRLSGGELVILDAGTGIRGLGDSLIAKGDSLRTYLLITHPHWDHIQGFPFFKPAFISGNEITIVGTERPEISLERIIAEQMTRIYFPIQLNELKAAIHFHPVREEEFPVFNAAVRTLYMNHPGFTVGYRIEQQGKSIVYISDNEPFDRQAAGTMANMEKVVLDSLTASGKDPNERVFDFARNADILIHDCTYTPEEYVDKVGWGHSHYLYTLKVAAEAGVRHLVLFHYEPNHSDDKIDEILRKCRREIKTKGYTFTCTAAREGLELSC
jgi:phosphoribosyl 1,2-cyclic phosphodiesterase